MRQIRALVIAALCAVASMAPAGDPRDALIYDAATVRIHALSFTADGTPQLDQKAELTLDPLFLGCREQVRAWGPDAVATSALMRVPVGYGESEPFCHFDRIVRRDDITGIWHADFADLGLGTVPDDSQATFDGILAKLPTADEVPSANCCPMWFPVEDERLVEVVRLINVGDLGAADALCAELATLRSDSIVLHLFLIDLAIMQGRDDVARDRILAFRSIGNRVGSRLLSQTLLRQELWFRGLEAANSGRNSFDKLRATRAKSSTMPGASQAAMDSAFASMLPGDIYVDTNHRQFLADESVPNFLDIQVATKVARVRADAALLRGEPEAALSVLEGYQRAAASLTNTSPVLIDHLIGVAVSAIVASGYAHVFLNAWDSPTGIEESWPRLTEARDGMAQDREAEPVCMQVQGRALGPDYIEAETRRRVAIVRWTLLQTATAARHRLLDRGDFPKTAAEFAPLLPGGPDFDAFAPEGVPLRWLPEIKGEWTAYSIGPDRADQRAAVEYDPTNGTLSAGDVSIRVRRERKYRFPVRGERPPRTNAEFRARYGTALPPDPFADTRWLSYMVGDGEPLRILSFGPDTDERECIEWAGRREGIPLRQLPAGAGYAVLRDGGVMGLLPAAMQQPIYDPTNGVISSGNIVLVGD